MPYETYKPSTRDQAAVWNYTSLVHVELQEEVTIGAVVSSKNINKQT